MTLNPEGYFISSSALSVSWSPLKDVSEYSVTLERCPESSSVTKDSCPFLAQQFTSGTSLIIRPDGDDKDLICRDYVIRVGAHFSRQAPPTPIKESILLPKSLCMSQIPYLFLIITAIILGLILLFFLLALYFYHKKRPFHRVQRVRSRVYTRLYSKDKYERPYSKTAFITTVQELLSDEENGVLESEFSALEALAFDTIQRRMSSAWTPVNRKRNRYQDVVPFDATRVKLERPIIVEGDTEASDYINASYISDINAIHFQTSDKTTSTLSSRKRITLPRAKYIAAQGPGNNTTGLFWEMIWQKDVRILVMLTNLVEGFGFNSVKCSLYWPETIGLSHRYNAIEVQLYDVQEAPDYVVRKFDVSRNSESREVVHIQYNSWPDRTAPEEPEDLLQLIRVVRALSSQYNNLEYPGPILVHCSAGVGRSGTYIAVDQLISRLEIDSNLNIDVFHTVYQLRRDRRYMVQTYSQYAYVYKCVLAYLKKNSIA